MLTSGILYLSCISGLDCTLFLKNSCISFIVDTFNVFPLYLTPDQKPDVMYSDIGGMDIQKQEVREAVELPLTHFELYKQASMCMYMLVGV